ncbi:MAG: hypothetical protein K6U80_07090 [Firmicutes bacterium]|nr:hypothetical protein [Bacillota bacterium]
MKVLSLKLGCLGDNEYLSYEDDGKVRRKKHYHLQPLVIERPKAGWNREKITCQGCGQEVIITVYSPQTVRLRRLSALLLSLLPIILALGCYLLKFKPDSFEGGFAAVIFLSLVWMIPVFLPDVFRKEFKMALAFQQKKPGRHRFFEANVESVTTEYFY